MLKKKKNAAATIAAPIAPPAPVLAPDIRFELLKAINLGMSVKQAAKLVRVPLSVIRQMTNTNAEFAADLACAEATFEQMQLTRIAIGGDDWKAAAWALERKIKQWRIPSRPVAPEPKPDPNELLTPDPALVSAEIPPGAIPPLEGPKPVQDDSRGAPVGKD